MKSVLERMEEIGAKERMTEFIEKQSLPYEQKKYYALGRVVDFLRECNKQDYNSHISVGGLDSITLFMFINYAPEMEMYRKYFGEIPAISASYLEDKSIQLVHRALGVESVAPAKDKSGKPYNKARIIQEFGFSVLSKEIAGKIETLQNPTDKNKTVRHAIITGETGEYGGFQNNSRMKMPQKWLEKFGGYENENEGVNYSKPDFKVSSRCCYYLKEKPCDDWAKEHHSVPFLGLMASEGGRRAKSLKINGCNYWGKTTIRSCPFAIFTRQDLLKLAVEMNELYKKIKSEIKAEGVANGRLKYDFEMPDSIVPAIYGEIVADEDGTLRTTGAQRTGCSMCGFGIHMEKRPHRFDLLRERNEKEWRYWMYECCTDENGHKFGWAKVLDYIGVDYL